MTAQEAIAEAWASIDGDLERFRTERGACDYGSGTFVGYMAEAAELIKRIEKRGFTIAPTGAVAVWAMGEDDGEEAADLVSLSKDRTGADNTVFVSSKGYGRSAPRIKIAVDPPDKFSATGKNASMAIHDYSVAGAYLSPRVLEQAKQFIERNRDVLLDYWNEKMDTPTMIGQLKPPIL